MNKNPSLTLQDIEAEEKQLQTQLAELAVVKRFLLRKGHDVNIPDEPRPPAQDAVDEDWIVEAELPLGAKKKIILAVIAYNPSGATTQNIVAGAIAKGFDTARVNNISPKLSFYKSKGWLSLDNGLWKITEAGQKELVT